VYSCRCAPYASSTGIVAGAVMVKVPQIQRILSKQSVDGLRFQMFAAEVISGTVAIAYFIGQGMALAAYAELFFILAQNLVILGLMVGLYKFSHGLKATGFNPFMPVKWKNWVSTKFAFNRNLYRYVVGFYGGKGKKGSGLSELLPAGIVYCVMTFALASGMIPQVGWHFTQRYVCLACQACTRTRIASTDFSLLSQRF
jgi:hypothetical protein